MSHVLCVVCVCVKGPDRSGVKGLDGEGGGSGGRVGNCSRQSPGPDDNSAQHWRPAEGVGP